MRALSFLLLLGCSAPEVHPGDLVFQTSRSRQSAVIREVTGSPWTHVGVAFERDGRLWVLEAVEPVRWTPFEAWRARGVSGRYLVRRPREPLDAEELRALRRAGERFLGRHYDARFEWGDRRIYCSELVWKMFDRGLHVRLTEPQRWRDLHLSRRARRLARRRLGHTPRPFGRVVTPAALIDSPALITPSSHARVRRPTHPRTGAGAAGPRALTGRWNSTHGTMEQHSRGHGTALTGTWNSTHGDMEQHSRGHGTALTGTWNSTHGTMDQHSRGHGPALTGRSTRAYGAVDQHSRDDGPALTGTTGNRAANG